MTNIPFVALEIHDVSLYEPSRVLPFVDVMEHWGYNALVLHYNDLLDASTQLGLTANYGVSDLRLKKVRHVAAWLNKLTRRLDQFGAKLFLEIKEPSFHDYAVELYPDLLGVDGRPDPTHPQWQAFCRDKTKDLLDRVPNLGGLVINLSSPESRVSLPDHMAQSDAGLDMAGWFDGMIAAFQGPLAEAGKDLYVRDFSYTTDLQSDILAAVDRCDGAVSACIKITAHDYFPEFPENPVLRAVTSPLIVEFEAFGEHTGWGVIPNCRVGEFCRRMQTYRDIGANGILMRTSWEAIIGANALDSLSAVNVYALPKLIRQDADPKTLIMGWLKDGYDLQGPVAATAADLLLQSWNIPAASYWNGDVFPRHSCLPSSWQEGWLSMATSGMGRRDRELGLTSDDPRLTEKARETLFAAKEASVVLAKELAQAAKDLSGDLPNDLADLFQTFAWLPAFARQFELATKATFYAARDGDGDQARIDQLHQDLIDLANQQEQSLANDESLPHHHMVLFDPEQIRVFANSLPSR